MTIQERVFKLTPYKIAADKALAEGDAELAFENVEKFVAGCHEIFTENDNDPDYRRVGMMGYTMGAQYAIKILDVEFDPEVFDFGSTCADAAVLFAKAALDEKQEPVDAMKFVGVFSKALGFGRSEVVQEYHDDAEHWVAMLLKYAPNNSEVNAICQIYKKAKEESFEIQEWLEKNINESDDEEFLDDPKDDSDWGPIDF